MEPHSFHNWIVVAPLKLNELRAHTTSSGQFPQLNCCGSIEALLNFILWHRSHLVSTTELLWLHWSMLAYLHLEVAVRCFHNWIVVAPLKRHLSVNEYGRMKLVSTTELLWLHWSIFDGDTGGKCGEFPQLNCCGSIEALTTCGMMQCRNLGFHNWIVVAPLKLYYLLYPAHRGLMFPQLNCCGSIEAI